MTTPFDDTFPTSEIFVDCCGQRREFRIELLDNDRAAYRFQRPRASKMNPM